MLNQYTSTSNYFWMLCEGIYLHTLIIVAVFVGEQQLFWYYVLGWGESGRSDISLPCPNYFHLCFSASCFHLVVVSISNNLYAYNYTGQMAQKIQCLQRQHLSIIVHEDMLPADCTEDYIVTFLQYNCQTNMKELH